MRDEFEHIVPSPHQLLVSNACSNPAEGFQPLHTQDVTAGELLVAWGFTVIVPHPCPTPQNNSIAAAAAAAANLNEVGDAKA
jgi:hypothetical protein